jgi:hypothetical protein
MVGVHRVSGRAKESTHPTGRYNSVLFHDSIWVVIGVGLGSIHTFTMSVLRRFLVLIRFSAAASAHRRVVSSLACCALSWWA